MWPYTPIVSQISSKIGSLYFLLFFEVTNLFYICYYTTAVDSPTMWVNITVLRSRNSVGAAPCDRRTFHFCVRYSTAYWLASIETQRGRCGPARQAAGRTPITGINVCPDTSWTQHQSHRPGYQTRPSPWCISINYRVIDGESPWFYWKEKTILYAIM